MILKNEVNDISDKKIVVSSSNIQRYKFRGKTKYILKKIYSKDIQNKIIAPRFGRFEFFYDRKGIYICDHSCIMLLPKAGTSEMLILFVLGFLNSKIMRYYWNLQIKDIKNIYDKRNICLSLKYLYRLKIPFSPELELDYSNISYLVDQIVKSSDQGQDLKNTLNIEKEIDDIFENIVLNLPKRYRTSSLRREIPIDYEIINSVKKDFKIEPFENKSNISDLIFSLNDFILVFEIRDSKTLNKVQIYKYMNNYKQLIIDLKNQDKKKIIYIIVGPTLRKNQFDYISKEFLENSIFFTPIKTLKDELNTILKS
ncbi:MAG: hypothetical protein HeimC3_46440 [Candidatus Heimdallarchaeota archaeon LC_3]|nr:MAG: hypothetical protein HeimC3_46440 [Candidatus Heimdallarchaeota archaeon LC_3]